MYEITKEFHFSAAHRIMGHPKCGRLHGHNYLVIVGLSAHDIPDDGMLMDYGVLKAHVKPLIDKLDHFYLCTDAMEDMDDLSHRPDVVMLEGIRNTTAEELAEWFYMQLKATEQFDELFMWVEVSETPSTSAKFGDII